MPLSVTAVGAGTVELVPMLNVPLFAPIVPVGAAGGANTTPMVQLLPALTVNVAPVPQLPAFGAAARRK